MLYQAPSTVGQTIWQTYLHSGLIGNRASIPSRAGLITDLEITKGYFSPKDKFSFKVWVAESFGVFHGDAFWDTKIRFSKEVENSAEKIQFHASQKMVKQKDGSLITFFRNLEGIVNLFGNCFILIGWETLK